MDNIFRFKEAAPHKTSSGFYYQPLFPVHTTAPQSYRNMNRQQMIDANKHLFRESVDTNDQDWARISFMRKMQNLNMFHDFWINACYCCDCCMGSKDDNQKLNSKNYYVRKQAEKSWFEANHKCSNYFLDSGVYSTCARWTFQSFFFITYIVLFAMLIVYHQDAYFCNQFKENLKPNITSTEEFARKCDILTKPECRIQMDFSTYNVYQYSQIRLLLFVFSCVPYLFLYFSLQSVANNFMAESNPDNMIVKTSNGKKVIQFKSHCWHLPPSFIKYTYLFLYLAIFLGVGSFSLALDGYAIKSLANCHETAWSSLPTKSKPQDLPFALIVFNSITTTIGFVYFVSRAIRSVRKQSRNDRSEFDLDPENVESQPQDAAPQSLVQPTATLAPKASVHGGIPFTGSA